MIQRKKGDAVSTDVTPKRVSAESSSPPPSAVSYTNTTRKKGAVSHSTPTSTTAPIVQSSSGDWSSGVGLMPGRETLGPLFLMAVTPMFSIVFYHVCSQLEGDFLVFLRKGVQTFPNSHPILAVIQMIHSIWPSPWDLTAWKMIFAFLSFELALMRLVPGKEFRATMTPKGNQPIYKANGLACYIITLCTVIFLSATNVIRLSLVYDKFGNIISSMNVFAMSFCTLLLIKGHVAPSSSDSGSHGLIIDFYWGMELYPRILGWDVKMFTNCRAGMMFWAVGILCFAQKNIELNNGVLSLGMAVNVALQLIYISKFFLWEMGYMCSMDIQHDRAGYYICWGCLVWVPSVYTSHSFYLATHAPDLSTFTASLIFLAGFACIWINYDADNQRYMFRQLHGQCSIWGSNIPPRFIEAQYTTSTGEVRKSLLLADGWWRISRHFHYMPEILASFFWSLPALNTGFIAPYFYVMFLTLLLIDRAFRDDDRCKKKYGKYWDQYCDEVPYRIVPFIL